MKSPRRNQGLIDQMAIARASGVPVAVWARENRVSVSTAAHWEMEPIFRRRVTRLRRELARQTISLLAERLAGAIVQAATPPGGESPVLSS